MTQLKKIKDSKRARIGFYSAGLNAYWEQFAGLYDCLKGYNQFIEMWKKAPASGEPLPQEYDLIPYGLDGAVMIAIEDLTFE